MKLYKSIFKELKKHLFDYLLFISACVAFVVALYIFRGDRSMEFYVVSAFVIFYIFWGIYHHIIDNTLRLKVVLEYILLGFTTLFLLKIIILP